MSSCVGCLLATDDYLGLARVWLLTSKCHSIAEAARTTLLETFRIPDSGPET
ncbi:hypothetical protein PIB30_090147, partial [Stylosanthes scabra]|nr:hypothetical protein [Stylosanthes scabra]